MAFMYPCIQRDNWRVRLATPAVKEQCRCTCTARRGVHCDHKLASHWTAQLLHQSRLLCVGHYRTESLAHAAYDAALINLSHTDHISHRDGDTTATSRKPSSSYYDMPSTKVSEPSKSQNLEPLRPQSKGVAAPEPPSIHRSPHCGCCTAAATVAATSWNESE